MNHPTLPQLLPLDDHNLKLQSNVHPRDWQNPTPTKPYHLVVIGAGTAGLVAAAGAAGLGVGIRVALIERELMGGDCLNVGCVPSKALISSARIAAVAQSSEPLGVTFRETSVDFAAVMQRMRAKRASISPVDSAHRFKELGVDVFFGKGSFVDEKTISVASEKGTVSELTFKKAVIATGARAAAPPIDGLESVPYLTNETLFSLTELPKRLGIIGSGPIGAEMAQTFARLGSEVFLFERGSRILAREDEDAGAIVQKQFERDGIRLVLNSQKMKLASIENAIEVSIEQNGKASSFNVDQLLVAVGRAPNIDGLNLESAGVVATQDGVEVNDFLQTTNPRIYAAGDICSKLKFTHAADFQARMVIKNALFAVGPFGRMKSSKLVIPWATYTTPELAQVGITESEAKSQGIPIDVYRQNFEHIDRAILEGREDGFVKVIVKKGTDKIVGATIVAENAGDLISELALAMTNGIGLSGVGSTIHPYPTQAESIRKLGDQYNRTRLTSTSRKLLGFLRWFNVGM